LASARVSRAGDGVSPQRTFSLDCYELTKPVSAGRACATQHHDGRATSHPNVCPAGLPIV